MLGVAAEAAEGCSPADLGLLTGDDEFGSTLSRFVARGCAASVVMPFSFAGTPPTLVGMTLLPVEGGGWTVILIAFQEDDAAGGSTGRTSNATAAGAPKPARFRARATAILGLGLGFAIMAGVFVATQRSGDPVASPSPSALSAAHFPAGPLLVAAEKSSVTSTLSVVGTIEPNQMVNVVAPFAGTVDRKPVEYGIYVERGQELLVMNTFDLDMKIRDAEAALLKAEQRIDEARNWTSSPDVSRARRQIVNAERDVNQARRRVQDAKPLFDQDIIPRQEYEELQRQLEAQTGALASARDDLAAALKRGGTDTLRMTELELGNARARLDELQEQRRRASVKAPLSGLVLKPPSSAPTGQSASASIELGSAVTANQVVLMIADMEALTISARVDEMDINRVHIGQPVDVTGEAFPGGALQGRISWVSSQGTAGENGSPSATFGIRVALPVLPEDQKRYARFGMSVNLSVKVYENQSAVVVPHAAVQKTPDGASLRIRDRATGAEVSAPVLVGETMPNGLEIRSGVKPGEMLVVDPAR
jgi:multidrug efflux pump subunit AcrA (membrane-fusion protein)